MDDPKSRQRNVLPHDQLRNYGLYSRYLAEKNLSPLQRIGGALEGGSSVAFGLGLIVSPFLLVRLVGDGGSLAGTVAFLVIAELLCLFLGRIFILFGVRVLRNVFSA